MPSQRRIPPVSAVATPRLIHAQPLARTSKDFRDAALVVRPTGRRRGADARGLRPSSDDSAEPRPRGEAAAGAAGRDRPGGHQDRGDRRRRPPPSGRLLAPADPDQRDAGRCRAGDGRGDDGGGQRRRHRSLAAVRRRGRIAGHGRRRHRNGVERAQPARLGWQLRARPDALGRARDAGPRRQRRPGCDRCRVSARCRPPVQVRDRGLLGDRRRRWNHPGRRAVAGTRWRRRDRPRRRQT